MTKPRFSREEIRARLTGPVPSIQTPFLRDGGIDFDSLRRMIDFDLGAGAAALMLTAGNSHYVALSEREIAEVTRVTLEHAAGRALVIAADRYYHTTQSIEFAAFCRDAGADLLMVMPPDWAGSCTPRTLAEHYQRVSAVMPVMVVSNVFIARGQKFGLETLELVRDSAKNVVAIKDDMAGEFGRKMSLLVHGAWAVVSGGQKQHHLNLHPYGCDGYLSTFLQLKPELAHAYWRAVTANDLPEMRRIIRDYEYPFFELIFSLPGGFDAALHGVLEVFKLAPRWRRQPYHSLTDREMDVLRAGLQRIGISP